MATKDLLQRALGDLVLRMDAHEGVRRYRNADLRMDERKHKFEPWLSVELVSLLSSNAAIRSSLRLEYSPKGDNKTNSAVDLFWKSEATSVGVELKVEYNIVPPKCDKTQGLDQCDADEQWLMFLVLNSQTGSKVRDVVAGSGRGDFQLCFEVPGNGYTFAVYKR